MTPEELLSWRPAARPIAVPSRGDDLALALVALGAAIDLAEQHGAPPAQVATLRSVAREVRR